MPSIFPYRPRPGHSGDAPLIVTLVPDPASHALFDRLRTAHFPPERLLVGAHVTMFHALPGSEFDAVADILARAAAATRPMPFTATGPVALSRRGVAIALDCPSAKGLKRRLAGEFDFALTPQDRGGMRPHVTIQNKVTPDVAGMTLATVRAGWSPRQGTFRGLALWRYLGGPWEPAGDWTFREPIAGAEDGS